MWKPLSITHGNGGGIQSDDTIRQSLLDTQVRTPGSNVASLAQTFEKDPRKCTEQREHLSEIWGEVRTRVISRFRTRSGHPPSSEFNAGLAMDRGKRDEISASRRHRQRNRYTLLITAGGLSYLRLHAKYSLYLWRSDTRAAALDSSHGFERH